MTPDPSTTMRRESNRPFSCWPLSFEGEPPARVAWTRQQPLSFVGAWEPVSFRTRAGYAYDDEEAFAAESEFSDAALRGFVASGANLIVIPFSKGFGLSAVAEETAAQRDLAARAKAAGLRVGVYIRVDSLVPELARADFPGVDDCLVTGMGGRSSWYSDQQTFRRRLCYMRPGSMEWLEELISHAVGEIGADLLHFDGFGVSYTPAETCRCPHCLTAYRAWLRQTFPTAADRRRMFGAVDFDHIEFPDFDSGPALPAIGAPLPPIVTSPDMQAWHRFVWAKQLAFTRHIRRHVRQLSPDVAISANPGWTHQFGIQRLWGLHVEELLPWLDQIWTEDACHLDYVDGVIRSRSALLKTAREYDIPVCHYHWSDHPGKISASLAFGLGANGGNPSCLGFTFRYLPHYTLGAEVKKRFADFARTHWGLLGRTRPEAEIAILRHHPSLSWNATRPWPTFLGLQQVLLSLQVPWRCFDRLDPERLTQVRTLILPDTECLSDAELKVLHSWVEGGGQLFFTGGSGTHTDDRRRRSRCPLRQWLDPSAPPPGPAQWYAWISSDISEIPEHTADADGAGPRPVIVRHGRGRLGFFPRVAMPKWEPVVHRPMSAPQIQAPTNAAEITAFLHELHGPFAERLEGPPSLLFDKARSEPEGVDVFHVVRVDQEPGTIDAKVHSATGWQGARVLSADQDPPRMEIAGSLLHLHRIQRHAIVIRP